LDNASRKKNNKPELLLETNKISNECDQPKMYKVLMNQMGEEGHKETTSTKEISGQSRKGKISIKNQKKFSTSGYPQNSGLKASGISSAVCLS
jgi:hypothetical protein